MATTKSPNNTGNKTIGRVKNESARSLPPTQKRPPIPTTRPPKSSSSK